MHFVIFCTAITFFYYKQFWWLGICGTLLFLSRKPSALLIFLLGISATAIDAKRNGQKLIETNLKNVKIKALLEDISHKEKSKRYSLSRIEVLNKDFKIEGKIMAYCKKCNNLDIRPNTVIHARINAFPLPEKVYPTGYDIKNKYRYLGYSGFAFINNIEILSEKPETDWLSVPTQIRNYYISKLENINSATLQSNVIPSDTIGLTEALFFGEMSRVSSYANDNLRAVGVSHIISISGLHVSIVMMIISFAVFSILSASKWVRYYIPIRKTALIIGLLFSFCYLAIANMPIPGIRSFIMLAFAVTIIMADLKPRAFASVILAGFVILLIYPHTLFFVSFQLSFLAVLALALTVDDSAYIKNLLLRYCYITIKTSLAISIITLPVVLYHFGTVSTIGPIFNIIAIPYFTFIVMPLGVAYFSLTPLLQENSTVLHFLGNAMFESITQFLHISELLADLQYAFFSLKEMPLFASLIVLTGVIIAMMIRGLLRFIGCSLCIIGMVIYILSTTPDIVANKDSFVFKYVDGKYYTIEDVPEGFVGSIWRGKLGLKDNFLEGSQFCNDQICTTKRFTYLKPGADQYQIDETKCTDILISRIDLQMDSLPCKYKMLITKEALNSEPYIVLRYDTL